MTSGIPTVRERGVLGPASTQSTLDLKVCVVVNRNCAHSSFETRGFDPRMSVKDIRRVCRRSGSGITLVCRQRPVQQTLVEGFDQHVHVATLREEQDQREVLPLS